MKAPRARCRARAACIMDNGFRFAINSRGGVIRTKSNVCVRPSVLRNYIYLRPKILVSYFTPVQTSFLGWTLGEYFMRFIFHTVRTSGTVTWSSSFPFIMVYRIIFTRG